MIPVHRQRAAPRLMRWPLAPFALAIAMTAAPLAAAPALEGLTLPPGFRIEAFAADVPNARSLAIGARGTVFVGTRKGGTVYAIRPAAKGGREVLTLFRDLDMPNGIAYRDGALYVAENAAIFRYDDIEARLDAPPKPVRIATLPDEDHHGWRYIDFGPDGKLYVGIGVPCNVCDRDSEDFATIVRMNADGSGREVIARGVRNTVGFAWHPVTRELWFTDNGRDLMGDEVPHCELNRLETPGAHFGFPFCHATGVADPEFGARRKCADSVQPVLDLGPHVAPLGTRFYTGDAFPASFRNQLFIAQHGSWNRTEKIGYRVMLVRLDGNRVTSYEPFITGWLKPDGTVTGRPVDLLQLPDGSMLVSDDRAGAIYRVYWAKE